MSKQYLFIGASAASMGALHKIRQLDPHARVTIFCQEKELPYNKCFLADFLAGISGQDRLSIYKASEQVTLLLDTRIETIDPIAKTVTCDQGTSYSYDALFLGMGSAPWIPSISGIHIKGVFTFHTLADTVAIKAYLEKNQCKNVLIIGAGLSGLEAADALKAHGLTITVVEKNNQVLPHLLISQAADFLHDHMQRIGINLITNATVVSIEHEKEKVARVCLDNGKIVAADIIIVATGLKANTDLCKRAGIVVGPHGVLVDEFMQTSQPGIYAAGDLIEVTDTLTGNRLRSCMWPDAMQQGMYAAQAMAGQPKPYAGPAIIVSSAFFGLKFAQAGVLSDSLKIAKKQGFFHAISQKEGVLQGFQVLGKQHDLGLLRRLILTQQPLLDRLNSLFE